MKYFSRKIEPLLFHYLDFFSVVGITGPRQSGKSTLIKELLGSNYFYVSFDDYRSIEFFKDDPQAFINKYNDKVIFDEVQKVPELFNYIKLAVDNDRSKKGKFVITGSSQFNLMESITESLAGRIGLLTLFPFQRSEIPFELKDDAIFKGSYPEPVIQEYNYYLDWYSSYVETFVLRDVKTKANLGDLHDFRQFIRLMAVYSSQVLNMSTISRIIGVSVNTIKKWISVLEAAYILFLLQPYHYNMGKRIIKSPKVYFYDTGLLCFLTGITTRDVYEMGPTAGSIFENYVIAEVIKNRFHTGSFSAMYYYRTSNGNEVNLVVEGHGKTQWIEIKKSATYKSRMTASAEAIKKAGDEVILVYQGENLPYKPDVHILNYKEYLET